MAKRLKAYRVLKSSRIDGLLVMKGSILKLKKSVAKYHLTKRNIKLYKKRGY